ncbi:MAG: cupin domain-containing protein [Opitutaceae bacterium]
MTAAEIIALLKLEPLPNEGGFFRQTYVSYTTLPHARRAVGTAIYFLITPEGFSALHHLETDELWHFYAGDPVEHVMIDSILGDGKKHLLGTDLTGGQLPQLVVQGGYWQGARLAPGPRTLGWALLGCTMAPGWDEREFTLGERDALTTKFPEWAADIHALTR